MKSFVVAIKRINNFKYKKVKIILCVKIAFLFFYFLVKYTLCQQGTKEEYFVFTIENNINNIYCFSSKK